MRRGLLALSMFAGFSLATSAGAEELAFGSETWRGKVLQVKDLPLARRAGSAFGNGDTVDFVAVVPKGSTRVTYVAFFSASPPDASGKILAGSIAPVLDGLSRAGNTTAAARMWVDGDADRSVQGTVSGGALFFDIGSLETNAAAKFLNGVRNGGILHVAVVGQDRRYVLRGSFAALSELVGCALKARDGEIAPPMPKTPAVAATAPPPPPTSEVVPVVAPPPQTRPMPRSPTSSGSGIVVTTDGHVLTNQHVVNGCATFGLRTVGDQERPAILLGRDAQNDLALLKASKPYPVAAVLRVEPPRLGENVLVFGFPLTGVLASSGNLTLGSVSGLSGLRDDSRDIQITAAVQPGNSGGPVFDASGLLLGVVQSKLDAILAASLTGDIPQNVNFAIRGSLAVSFLGSNGIEPAFERRRPPLPGDEVADHAQKVTVQVFCYGGER